MNEDVDNEFHRVFRALDEGSDPMPDYADRLWQELDGTLAGTHRIATSERTGGLIVEPDEPDRRDRGGWSARSIAASAAVAASIAIVAFIAIDRDPQQSVDATDGSPLPAEVVSTDEACAVYFEQAWSVDRLVDVDLADADFDAALRALDRLGSRLDAAGVDDLQPIEIVQGLVRQAELEVESGDVDRARRTLERAPDIIRFADGETGEETCVPADD